MIAKPIRIRSGLTSGEKCSVNTIQSGFGHSVNTALKAASAVDVQTRVRSLLVDPVRRR